MRSSASRATANAWSRMRKAGLLGKAWKAEPSNSQRGAAERERLRDEE